MSLKDEIDAAIREAQSAIARLEAVRAQAELQHARPALRVEPSRPAPARVVAGPWAIKCCMGDDACNNGPNCRNRDDAA